MKTRDTFFRLVVTVVFAVGTTTMQAAGPIITRANVPVIGQTITHQNVVMTGNIKIGAAGENVVWDYTTLQDSLAPYTEVYLSPSTTPAYGLFPAANVAVRTQQNTTAYTYFILNDNQMVALGTASSSDTDVMSDSRILSTFPRSYQSSFIDTYAGHVTGTSNVKYTATDSSYVDGYGTLNLPHGLSYTNVARVVSYTNYSTIDQTDTTKKHTFQMKHYSHYATGVSGGSLFSVSGIVLLGYRISAVDYVTGVSSDVHEGTLTSGIALQPNPAQDILLIRGSDQGDLIGRIEVYNQVGELIMQADGMGTSVQQLNINSLPSGVIFLRITMNNRVYEQSVCVVH